MLDLTLALNALEEIQNCTDIGQAQAIARLTLRTLGHTASEPPPKREIRPYEPSTLLVKRWGPVSTWGDYDPSGDRERRKERLLALLRDNPKATYRQMQEAIGVKGGRIAAYLNELAADGLIERGHGCNVVLDGNKQQSDDVQEEPDYRWLGSWHRKVLRTLDGKAMSIGELKEAILTDRDQAAALRRALHVLQTRGLIREWRRTEGPRSVRYFSRCD